MRWRGWSVRHVRQDGATDGEGVASCSQGARGVLACGSMGLRLHVNIDHVATLRNARGTVYPDPVLAAALAELAGADGVTAHLREDRRHIRDEDLQRLRAAVSTWLNMECAVTDEMIAIARLIEPDMVTLVPERREERTTEGGLDVLGNSSRVEQAVSALKGVGIRVSLFLAPEPAQLERGLALQVDQIELHTGEYCHRRGPAAAAELSRLARAAARIKESSVALAAGHGLTRHNVGPVASLPGMEELNIGHAIISDALFLGLKGAVQAMRAAIERALTESHGTGVLEGGSS